MTRIEFHPEAEQEVAEAQVWYRERSEVAAQALALEIDRAIQSIAEAPHRLA
ncbi:MAG: type II toxin-antitoxin system RelE/ParE family toxin [Gammaproteobacteria bacterium]